MGLLEDRKKSQYLQMAEEKLQGLLNLPQQAQRFLTSPTAFLGLLGQNPLPRESGFAAGATGLPPTEMSVLDPNQAAYMQGYGQGEPVGYAGMALPFAAPAAVATGKALAPKLGQVTENYMVRQGMIQPLTAYHGSPYRFDKFDPEKIGAGEGAQAYGHGMYFAENPLVASKYLNIVPSGMSATPNRQLFGKDVEPMTPEYKVSQLVDEMGVDKAKKFVADWAKDPLPDQVGYVDSLQTIIANVSKKSDAKNLGTSNFYKVDIPDKDIPFMLDYDKRLSQQTKAVQDAIKNAPFDTVGNDWYGRDILNMAESYAGTGRDAGRNPAAGSKLLNELGIKGVRYKDEMSQGFGKGTSNFVVFDPSAVKILERNKKKVEGLLD
jgi:hypothetical protein